MKTYNTYQEAKIANPESVICEFEGYFSLFKDIGSKECNPADHCMTVDKFLAGGHKFVDGDLYQNEDGRVFTVGSLGYEAKYCNLLSSYCFTSKISILRAAALENIPTETPEEKEALDGIEIVGEIEWKNGDECVYEHQPDVTYMFIGMHPVNKKSAICWNEKEGIAQIHIDFILKPETPQQREELERLESAYDLYCHIAKMSNRSPYSFDQFSSDSTTCYRKEYLEIVCKTKYRKEKAHGAN